MPTNDYNDPELRYPRLEARFFHIEDDVYLVSVWLHRGAGSGRERLVLDQRAGSSIEAHSILAAAAVPHNAVYTEDDIVIELPKKTL